MSQKGMKETRQVGIPDAKECDTRHSINSGKRHSYSSLYLTAVQKT